MKIGQKLILGLVSIALLIEIVGYICLKASQKALQESIGESSASLAATTLDRIDRSIYSRIEEFLTYPTDLTLQEVTKESNKKFESLDDIQSYIEQKDKEWTSAPKETVTAFMQELINNRISEELRNRQKFYEEEYGYAVFGEFFVTNKYGANVAQTGKTTDYRQDDEQWWQNAKKDGLYVTDVGYDDSADVYSTDIGIRIEDEAGNFVGVMKLALNIQEAINVINETGLTRGQKWHKTMHINLLTKEGKNIYSTKPGSQSLENIDVDLFSRFGQVQEAEHKCYFIGKADESAAEEHLFVHAHSKGYKDYKGLGWILVVEHDTKEIFAPVAELRKTLLLVPFGATILALVLALFISHFISTPITKLKDSAAEIGAGNFDTYIEIKSNDEIGQLGASFKKMAEDLKTSTTSTDNLNQEITERKKAEERMLKTQAQLKSVLHTIPSGLFTVDLDRKVTSWNRMAESISGLKMEDVIGKKCTEIWNCPTCLKKCGLYANDVKKPIFNKECQITLPDGKRFLASKNLTYLLGEEGEIIGGIESFTDITDRKKADKEIRQQNEFLNNILESLTHPFYVIDANDYTIKIANSAAGLDDLPEKTTCYALTHKRDKPCADGNICPLQEAKKTKKPVAVEHIHYDKDGNSKNVEVQGYPIFDTDGNVVQMIEYSLDITERKKAEDALLQERDKAQKYLDVAGVMLVAIDTKQKVCLINKKGCEILGYKEKEILGKNWFDNFLPERIRGQVKAVFEKVIRAEADVSEYYENPILTKSGGERLIAWHNTVMKDEKGSVIAALSSGEDITESKNVREILKKALEEWESTFNAAEDSIMLINTEFKIVQANLATSRFLGKPLNEILGKTCHRLFHGTDAAPEVCPLQRTKQTRKHEEVELCIPEKDMWIVASVDPILDDQGNLSNTVHIIRDITERKKAEEVLESLNEDLESAVRELNRSNKELQDFAHVTAHDLKSPLRAIGALAHWISTDYADKFDEDGREQMKLLMDRVKRMHNLIEAILHYSRIGREKEKHVQVNLNELVPEVIDMVAPPRNITITTENQLPVIECEETNITQVFQNLLSNAVKYLDKPQGQIRISCVEEEGSWKFSVADNGPGIEEKYFEKIFQIFQTLSPRDEVENTGVGLTIIKKIVELYGGKIWIESKPGEGSTFFFTIPKQQVAVEDAKLKADTVC